MNQLASSDADDGMLRMSILEHLEELRSRIIRALIGFGLCLLASMALARPLWTFVQRPLKDAIAHVHGQSSPSPPPSSSPLSGCGLPWWLRSFWRRRG